MFVYAVLPIFGLGLFGAGTASAHGWFGAFSRISPDEIATRQTAMFESQAKLLGITVSELKDKWAEGKTILDIAKEKGLTEEQLQAKMKEEAKTQMRAQLQVLVDKGIIAQAQADKRLQFMEKQIGTMKKGRGFHMGRGFGF